MRSAAFIIPILICMHLVGCQREEYFGHPDPYAALQAFDHKTDNESVARVNGRDISVGEFRVFWEKHPEMDRESALNAMLARDVLAQQSFNEQLAAREALDFVRKQAMVDSMLRDLVESEVDMKSVDNDDVDKTVEILRHEQTLPAGLQASHVVVLVPGHAQDRKWQETNPEMSREELFEKALPLAMQLYNAIGDDASIQNIAANLNAIKDTVPEPFDMVMNEQLRFPIEFSGRLPTDWMPVVPEFQEGAKELYQSQGKGVLSGPVRSDFGWHLIVVEKYFEAYQPDDSTLREEAMNRVLNAMRTVRLEELIQQWESHAQIQLFPRLLSRHDSMIRD